MKSPIEVATAFWREPRGCTCGDVDIGAGVMHEPFCGLPSPDELADLIAQARAEVAQACLEAARKERSCWGWGLDGESGVAERMLAAVERAAREAGAKEPTP